MADASAVQFTRNPEGIADALKKIGGFSEHGKISSAKAIEARHMFFAGSGFSMLMATHPPLEKRILAIDPNWKGQMKEGKADPVRAEEFGGAMGFAGAPESPQIAKAPGEIGDSGRMDLQTGSRIREELRDGNVTSFSKQDAKTVVLGLLVATDSDGREAAKELLQRHGVEGDDLERTISWSRELESYTSSGKLALVDLALSWLRKMSRTEASDFVKTSQALITADGEVNLFEFMLQKVIERHVEIGLGLKPVPAMRHKKLASLEAEMSRILWAFAELAGGDSALVRASAEYREITGRDLPRSAPSLGEVARALPEMDASTPLVKQQILRLCALVATDDGVLEDGEVELLRATAEAIGAPLPPVLREAM